MHHNHPGPICLKISGYFWADNLFQIQPSGEVGWSGRAGRVVLVVRVGLAQATDQAGRDAGTGRVGRAGIRVQDGLGGRVGRGGSGLVGWGIGGRGHS
jgi:hypothetical protein